MIGFNGTYLPTASLGNMRITAAAIGGQWVIGGKNWLVGATQQAIIAAFGAEEGKAVISKTNDYLHAIVATDTTRAQQLAMFIQEDPMLVVSLVETGKERYIHATSNLRAYIDVWTATDLKIVTKCATDGTTGGTNDTICGVLGWNSSWNKCDVGSFLIGFDKRNGQSFCYGTEHNWFNAIYAKNVKANTPYILDADYSRFIAYDINGNKLVQQNNTYYWTEGNERQMTMMGVGVIVYDCKIYKNGELYRHIVPFQGTDGACLVDVVNGTRYYPSTEGTFTIALIDKA